MREFMTRLKFQHTAARRRLQLPILPHEKQQVSTHSRPKAAGHSDRRYKLDRKVSTHSRPKAAEPDAKRFKPEDVVSTHSRPKAAEPLLKALFHQVSQPRFR